MHQTDRQRHSLSVVQRHIAAEFRNDVPDIMDTISRKSCWYPLLERSDTGLQLTPITSRDEAKVYYEAMRESVDVLDSVALKTIATDWYVFRESVAEIRPTAELGGVAPGDEPFVVNSAVFFPVADDGILGEIPWNRYDFRQTVRGASPRPAPRHERHPQIPVHEHRNLRHHEALLAAFCSGESASFGALFTEDAYVAVRNYFEPDAGPMLVLHGHEAIASEVTLLHDNAELVDVQVVTRSITDWYVFAEYLMRLRRRDAAGTELELRTAALYPVDEETGAFRGELGYGTDLDARSRPTDRTA